MSGGRFIRAFLPLLALLQGACGGDGEGASGGSEPAPDKAVTLQFAARVNGEDFACGATYSGVGAKGSAYTPVDLRLYAHRFRLVTADGAEVPVELTQDGAWQLDDLALLDFEDGSSTCEEGGTKETNTQVVGTVPAGKYTGVRFTLGVPFEKNHMDPAQAPSPLNVSSMYWVWLAGRKFVRIDGRTSGLGMGPGFLVHLGSMGCAGMDPNQSPEVECASPNRAEIEVLDYDPDTGVIDVDVGELLAEVDIDANTPDTAPGCMSAADDPECASILPRLGLPLGDVPAGQALFRAQHGAH